MNIDPSLLAIPVYFMAMLWESRKTSRMMVEGRDVTGYEAQDTVASVGTGIVSVGSVGVLSYLGGLIGRWMYDHRFFSVDGWMAWVVGTVVWDFVYYWLHRAEHEVRLLWASHVSHHSSERYNFSTALRQAPFPWGIVVAFPPIALLGVRPEVIVACGGMNLLYQFFIHTEVVGRLHPVVEYVFNTPSHHRVHHGSNPGYIDKNHGGILILWDRAFGTFKEEGERVVYGLTRPVGSYNLWTIFIHEYVSIVSALRRTVGWKNKLKLLLGNPANHF